MSSNPTTLTAPGTAPGLVQGAHHPEGHLVVRGEDRRDVGIVREPPPDAVARVGGPVAHGHRGHGASALLEGLAPGLAAAFGGEGLAADEPASFERLGQLGPVVRYDVTLPDAAFSSDRATLAVGEVRDLAWVSVDSVPVGRLSRALHERALVLPRGRELAIVVEDQGRVNYGPRLGEEKGLSGAVTLDGAPLTGWRATPVDLAAAAAGVGRGATGAGRGRAGWRGTFPLAASADLFLDTAAWGKGFAFVNGFFLGRYWRNGPQRTLYVPAPVTRAGENEIVVLELEAITDPVARFVAEPDLGHLEE